jgi:hypothetical protein
VNTTTVAGLLSPLDSDPSLPPPDSDPSPPPPPDRDHSRPSVSGSLKSGAVSPI